MRSGAPPPQAPGGPGSVGVGGPPPRAVAAVPDPEAHRRAAASVLRGVLRALRAEVQAAGSTEALPSDAELEAAAATAELGSPEARAVLAALAAASDVVGQPFPASLRAAGD